MKEYIKQLTDEYLRSIFTEEELEEQQNSTVENCETDYVAGINKVLDNPELFGLTHAN